MTKLDKDTDNDLRDLKYDHKPNMSKLKYRLSGGLGKLTDGQYGQHKNLYVGWRAPSLYTYLYTCILSDIYLCCNIQFKVLINRTNLNYRFTNI